MIWRHMIYRGSPTHKPIFTIKSWFAYSHFSSDDNLKHLFSRAQVGNRYPSSSTTFVLELCPRTQMVIDHKSHATIYYLWPTGHVIFGLCPWTLDHKWCYLWPIGHEKLQQKKHGEWWDVQVSTSDYDSLVTLSQVSPLWHRHDVGAYR